MDYKTENKIIGHQPTNFCSGTESYPLYLSVKEYWGIECEAFTASIFYSLGRVHGIREERARRKAGKAV